jgi:hypothetical protein
MCWIKDEKSCEVHLFVSSYILHMNKYVCKMCFQCIISVCEMYELWMNEFYMIFITKSWNVKFVM